MHYHGLSLSPSHHLTHPGKALIPIIQSMSIIPALSLPAGGTTLLTACLASEDDCRVMLIAVVALGCMNLDFNEFIMNFSGHGVVLFQKNGL